MGKWSEIRKEDVLKAIEIYDYENPIVPPAKNTFLKYKGKLYPAKHLRGMAYKVAFQEEISKSEYTGGLETVRFFQKLGFDVVYNGDKEIEITSEKTKQAVMDNKKKPAALKKDMMRISTKGVVEQKNALQLALNKYFNGDIVSEKALSWMVTPSNENNLYIKLSTSMQNYRGNSNFAKENYRLKCDFVCESKKIIFEYDERQHFTQAREIALEVYKNDIKFNYDVNKWINACSQIRAKDNSPKHRDETRAFYDSVRDIEAFNNGYRLIRIMHGTFDWESDEATEYLTNLLADKDTGIEDNTTTPRNEELVFIEDINTEQRILKVGLLLQDASNSNIKKFDKMIQKVNAEKLDLLVLPEYCYTPFQEECNESCIDRDYGYETIRNACMELSEQADCPIIYGGCDYSGITYSLYVNPFATGDESKECLHIKHTATAHSVFDMNYKDYMVKNFPLIKLKSFKIGMTICYDCNHSLFSRVYGLKGADLIINSTGGNVVHTKWYRYNKVRAIENNCFNLCTMGYNSKDTNKSYTLAFAPGGKAISHTNCIGKKQEPNVPGNIYIYDIKLGGSGEQEDISFNQKESISKKYDFEIYPNKLMDILGKAKKIEKDLYVFSHLDKNIVICLIDGESILKPEKICSLLYHNKLIPYKNKKYLLINRWDELDGTFYKNILSDVLKARVTENFVGLILISPQYTKCYQSGFIKNAQVVELQNDRFCMDTTRMGGAEVIWKGNETWRDGYELLLQYINSLIL